VADAMIEAGFFIQENAGGGDYFIGGGAGRACMNDSLNLSPFVAA
jgi:hypothetical protein